MGSSVVESAISDWEVAPCVALEMEKKEVEVPSVGFLQPTPAERRRMRQSDLVSIAVDVGCLQPPNI